MTTPIYTQSNINYLNINNTAGYSYSPIITINSIGSLTPLLTLTGTDGSLLNVQANGTVNWTGSPNRATASLVTMLQTHIDVAVVSEHALARSYLRAVKKCLRLAKNTDHSQLIEMLEKEIDTRESQTTLMFLKQDDDNG